MAHTLETTYPSPSANPGSSAFHIALPANTREAVDLKRQILESEDVAALRASGVALADITETAVVKSLIADETIRQIASAPKKSKSNRHHSSKAMLISRSNLDKARKKRIEKDSTTKAKKELHEQRKTQKGNPPLANGVSGPHVTDDIFQSHREGGGSNVEIFIPTYPLSPNSAQPSSTSPLGAMPLLPLYPISGN